MSLITQIALFVSATVVNSQPIEIDLKELGLTFDKFKVDKWGDRLRQSLFDHQHLKEQLNDVLWHPEDESSMRWDPSSIIDQYAKGLHGSQNYDYHEPHEGLSHSAQDATDSRIGMPPVAPSAMVYGDEIIPYKEFDPELEGMMEERCAARKPRTDPKKDPTMYGLELVSWQNCMFLKAWVEHVDTTDPHSELLMLSERDFAEFIFDSKMGALWDACYPQDQYFEYWLGVDGIPTGMDGGQAVCTGKLSADRKKGMLTGCKCAKTDISDNDWSLVLKGNCPKDNEAEVADCNPGAMKIAANNQWGKEMQWQAILYSLYIMREHFSESMHLDVEDIYWLKRHMPHMLDEYCPTCQAFAALRPMPFVKGIKPEYVKDDMVEFGTMTEEEYEKELAMKEALIENEEDIDLGPEIRTESLFSLF